MDNVTSPTPVYLLTGFLGSGKTTLLNALLKRREFANTAVIVNEFGEIGLDHYLIERSDDNVVLLDSGCLCCTVGNSLHETLADLNFRRQRGDIPAFNRVLIETTGLADPAPILNTLLGHRLVTDHYRLQAVIVTVDAQHVDEEIARHREVPKQIAVADRLVITKIDVAPAGQQLMTRLRSINPHAEIIESQSGSSASRAFAPLDRRWVDVDVAVEHVHERHADHDVNRHDRSIRAHCFVIDDPASWSGLAAWWRVVADRFGDRLLRCKGIVRIAETGEVVFIQAVQRVFHRPERLLDWPGGDERSRLVCITRDVEEAELRGTLAALQLPPRTDPAGAA